MKRDGMGWDGMEWNGLGWMDGMERSGMGWDRILLLAVTKFLYNHVCFN